MISSNVPKIRKFKGMTMCTRENKQGGGKGEESKGWNTTNMSLLGAASKKPV